MATLSEGVEGLLFLPTDFSLPCLILTSLFWVYVHQKLSLSLPYYFTPKSTWETHKSKVALYRKQQQEQQQQQQQLCAAGAEVPHSVSAFPPAAAAAAAAAAQSPKALRAYFATCRSNATAFLHAVLVCPMAAAVLYATMKKASEEQGATAGAPLWAAASQEGPLGALRWLLWEWAESDAFYNHHSFLLDVIAYLMGGYFVWDLFECIINKDVHSRAFILHALLSLYAMLSYLLTKTGKMTVLLLLVFLLLRPQLLLLLLLHMEGLRACPQSGGCGRPAAAAAVAAVTNAAAAAAAVTDAAAAAAAPTAAGAAAERRPAAEAGPEALYMRLREGCLKARALQDAQTMLLHAELLVGLAHPGGGAAATRNAGGGGGGGGGDRHTAAAATLAEQLQQKGIKSVCRCSGQYAAAAATAAATTAAARAATSSEEKDRHKSSSSSGSSSSMQHNSSSNASSNSSSSNSSSTRKTVCLHVESLRLFGEALLRSGCLERLLQQLLQAYRPWTLRDPLLLLLAATAHVDSRSTEVYCYSPAFRLADAAASAAAAAAAASHAAAVLFAAAAASHAAAVLFAAAAASHAAAVLLLLLQLLLAETLDPAVSAVRLGAADNTAGSGAARCCGFLSIPLGPTPLEFLACIKVEWQQQRQQQRQQQQQDEGTGQQHHRDAAWLLLEKCEQQLLILEQQQQQQQRQQQQQQHEPLLHGQPGSAALALIANRYPTPLLPPLAKFSHVSLSVQAKALHAERNIPLAFKVSSLYALKMKRSFFPDFLLFFFVAAELLSLLQRLKQQIAMQDLRFYAEGAFLLMQSRFTEAIACFREGLRRHACVVTGGLWGFLHAALGHALSAVSRGPQAANAFAAAAAALPGEPLALVLMGIESDPVGVSPRLMDCLQRAYKLRPRDPRVCYELSLANLKCNRVCDALPLARAAVAAAAGREFAFARALVSVHLARCLLRKAVLPASSDGEYVLLLLEAHALLQQQVEAASCRCSSSSSSCCCRGCCNEAHRLHSVCRFLMGGPLSAQPPQQQAGAATAATAAAAAGDLAIHAELA
ncbi:hypothetical protein Efla_000476 [Eimeria flavescens]